jgi:hypothetical protein
MVSIVNRLSTERRAQVIGCLVEGNSIRATVRMTGAAKNTVTKLLLDLGIACSDYQDGALRNLTCRRVQVDEIWSFVGCKKANVKPEHNADYGDAWTFVAIDADTKLVPLLVGRPAHSRGRLGDPERPAGPPDWPDAALHGRAPDVPERHR